jgi:hypothetical protein
MIHFHGTYRFKQHPVGVRMDYCTCCKKERVTIQIKSFDMYHLSFIPLIPLGWKTRWLCTECRLDPRAHYGVSRGLMSVFLGVLALFTGIMTIGTWAANPADATDMPVGALWAMRFIAPLLTALFVYLGFIRKAGNPDIAGAEQRKRILPLDGKTCPLCRQPATQVGVPTCTRCKVRIYTTTE